MLWSLPFHSRLVKASFPIRALVALLTLTVVLSLKQLLDFVCGYFHASSFCADILFYSATAPVVTLLASPALSFLAPFVDQEQSTKLPRRRQNMGFSVWDDDDFLYCHDGTWGSSRNSDIIEDWHTDPEYSWFSGNIHHDHS